MSNSQPELRNFIISPPVQAAMDAQTTGSPQPIRVIIILKDSGDGLDAGLAGSKAKVKEYLERNRCPFRESDFYLFASLLPAQILELTTEEREWVRRIWRDETTYAHLLESTETIKAAACQLTGQTSR